MADKDKDNVRSIHLKKAEKLFKAGKIKEADEEYNKFKKEAGRFDKKDKD